jgi:hypothetical protein
LVGWELAEQLALVPPFDPVQFQDQGPEPLTVVAVPALQRFEVGEEVNVAPLLLPHTPLVGWGALAEQLAFVPPFDPAQVQFHGPEPLTVVGFPVLQRFVVGADVKVPPLLLPQMPLMVVCCRFAEQFAGVPPFTPWHVQDQGPEPLTVVGFPVLQRFVVGADVKVPPLLLPQMPLMVVCCRFADQFAGVPPFTPWHVQDQGPEPLTVVGFPVLQSFVVGADVKVPPLLLPQMPLMVVCCRFADQFAGVPPFTPWHVQDQGPEPLTVVGFPVLQRFVVGADVKVTPLVLPQVPLTGWMLMEKIVPALLLPPNQVIPYIVEPDTTRLPQGLVPSLATVPSSNECKML